MPTSTGRKAYTDKDFSKVEGLDLVQCLNRGAYAKIKEEVRHYPRCQPGGADYWKKFYEED